MTFDEAIDEVKSHDNTYDETSGIMNTFSVLDIIDELRKKYAPTVEMTTFERTNAVGLLDFKRDELTFVVGSYGNEEPILDTLPKEYFSAWLHPETIKIVDE
ncbi:hypothetical protein EQZ98_03550 [Leuconostoc mesenteroides]|uniref:hypothetical protein n=1 Tax=Leuconostoc mesenteroides TaxID=1245 RepID=UPI000FFE2DAB|nr:hypothetical protein [Leuconostoc mesenteroides]QAT27254.1 hypothetical protein EQZ98_03550 [Leuconostoc mesenteroides]